MLTWIDWLMILGYFGVLAGVVVFSLRRNKIESGEDLFLGGLNFSCLSPEYKKANRASWNWIDVVASIFVVGCVIAAYAYFWTWLD